MHVARASQLFAADQNDVHAAPQCHRNAQWLPPASTSALVDVFQAAAGKQLLFVISTEVLVLAQRGLNLRGFRELVAWLFNHSASSWFENRFHYVAMIVRRTAAVLDSPSHPEFLRQLRPFRLKSLGELC